MLGILNIRKYLSIGRFISIFFYTGILLRIWMKGSGSVSLDNFNRRIISSATLAGIDVNARISLYYKSVVFGVLLILILLYAYVWFFRMLQSISKITTVDSFIFEIKIIDLLSFFGLITILFGFFGNNSEITRNFILCFQFLIFLLCILKSIAFRKSWERVSLLFSNRHLLIWQFLNSFVFMFYIIYFAKISHLNFGNQGIVPYLLGFVANLILTYAYFYLLYKKNNKANLTIRLIVISSLPIFITPMYYTISNELYLILNQRNINNIPPIMIFIFLFCISIIGGILLFKYANKTKNIINVSIGRQLQRFYYPLGLIMMAMILYQPAIMGGPPGELFESGNAGVTVDQFFKYGKIPLLETFNAHALSELVSPLIFSFLNGYHGWTSYLYFDIVNKIIYLLIAYFFLRKLISAELAFLTLLLFPFKVLSTVILPEYFCFAILAVFVLNRLLKQTSYINYLLFWFILICTFLWRFDIGTAAILSAIGVYFLYLILYKGKWNFKNFIFAGATIGGFWLILFILLALIKGVPVIFRLKELLSVVSSNQIWGYPTLGDNHKPKYYLYYFLVPILNVGITAFIIYRTKFIKKIKPEIFISLIFLLSFTFINFSRGLVRHSLVENFTSIIVGLLAIPLIYLPFLLWKKRPIYENYIKFIIFGSIYAVLFLYTGTGLKDLDTSLMGQTVSRFSLFSNYEVVNPKVERYSETQDFAENNYSGLKRLFDTTMSSKETFIDFSNAPYMYVLTGREAPMYINQTPAFLSDETTQISFLKEIESYSIPYVIFADEKGWTNLDGIPNNLRSYRISEYIYNNYVPYIKANGFNVWVKNDRKAAIDKLINISTPKDEIITDLFNALDTKKIDYNMKDIKFEININGLKLTSGTSDPQLFGILSAIKPTGISLENPKQNSLQLDVTSFKGGQLQIFYLLNDEPYNEKNSVMVELGTSGVKQTLNIPIPFTGILKDIRIDPPSNETLVIHSMKLVTVAANNLNYELYQFPQTIQDNLAWLPVFWGEYDPLHADEQTQVLADLTSSGLVSGDKIRFPVNISIDKSRGNYIHLRIRSKVVQDPYSASIEFGESINGNDQTRGQFIFNVIADNQFHDYFIRASSQYNWYKTNLTFIDLTLSGESEINIFNIRQGD